MYLFIELGGDLIVMRHFVKERILVKLILVLILKSLDRLIEIVIANIRH